MSYLIKVSDFIREYAVPNVVELNDDNNDDLMYYIDQKVPLFLANVLGAELFESLNSDIDPTTGDLKVDAADRWKDLVKGKTYIHEEVSYKWNGLVYSSGSYKASLLVPMVFHEWLSEEYSKQSGVGEVVVMPKNAVRVNPTPRIVAAWNDFVTLYQGNKWFPNMWLNSYRHNGVLVSDYFGGRYNETNISLVEFIRDQNAVNDNYKGAILPCLDYKNSLGLW